MPDRVGSPIFNAGTYVTTTRAPCEHRWGGWYVTGTHGKQTHMGNVTASDTSRGRDQPARASTRRPGRT